MGERGPLPKPHARRRNYRPVTGTVPVARPTMPKDLAPEAKAEWKRIVPELEQAGVLASIDRSILVRYCSAWAEWVETDRLIRNSAVIIKGQKGLVRNPLILVRSDLEQTLSDLGRQLGLTPIARLRAGVKHERPPDPREEEDVIAAMEDYRRRLNMPDPRRMLTQ